MSLYGNRRYTTIREERQERLSPLVIDTTREECVNPTCHAPEAITTPHSESDCKSPFVTPSHPLYIFGDVTPPSRKALQLEPVRPQKASKCRESIGEISVPSRKEEVPSPFRSLCLSPTFDEREGGVEGSQYETPRQNSEEPQVQHRVIRKTSAFGMERIREMSVDSPFEQNLMVIEGDLEDEDGLATRLRRMKRRLFLENITTSASHEQEPSQQTPKHSNRMDGATMEGMEVVLDDQLLQASTNSIEDKRNGFYLTFSASSSSSSLRVDIEQDGEPTETSVNMFPKQTTMDCSLDTEATTTCSTFENEDMHWASVTKDDV